ncbi:beta clamp domain-containing protein [Deferrisoma camini]|uniref:hypothetical protein n=1 Tax=Deferrisoma camini TaxID=1035120 RepID=UPI00046CD7B1|nr:hypothetical protein [Deferrisoma camini]
MQIRVEARRLVRVLKAIMPVAEGYPQDHDPVELRVEAGALWVRASDTRTHVEARLDGAGPVQGAVTVSARALLAAVRSEPEAVELRQNGSLLEVTGHRYQACLGNLGEGLVPDPPQVALPRDTNLAALRLAVERVRHAVSRDITRPVLRCVHLVPVDGGVLAEVTDSHRAAWSRAECPHWPREVLLEAEHLLPALPPGEGQIAADDDRVLIVHADETAAWRWVLRQRDGVFPDVSSVAPRTVHTLRVSAAELLERTRQVLPFAPADVALVRLRSVPGSGELVITSGPGLAAPGSATASVGCSHSGDDEIEWGWNAKYAVQACEAAGDVEITLTIQDPLAPILLRTDALPGWGEIIMPVRLE